MDAHNRWLARDLEQHRLRASRSDQAATAVIEQSHRAARDIMAMIANFEGGLDDQHEVRLVVVGGPSGALILPQTIYPAGHDRLIFTGRDQDGCAVLVMQHVSQLNIMLKVVQVEVGATPERTGFHVPAAVSS